MNVKSAWLPWLFCVALMACSSKEAPKFSAAQKQRKASRDYCIDTMVRAGETLVKTLDTCGQQYPDLPLDEQFEKPSQ